MNVEEELGRLKERVEQLEDENKLLKSKLNSNTSSSGQSTDKNVSRRDFLKKMGVGALGLGALSLPSASALNMRSNDFTFYGADSMPEFQINDGGPVEIQNSNLQLNSNRITQLADPVNPQDAVTRNWANNNYNYFSGSHNDLTNISSNDHHSRYTDNEARNAVSGSILENFHGYAYSEITASGSNQSTDWNKSHNLMLESSNNALSFFVDSTSNGRKAFIQAGHASGAYSDFGGRLDLNPFGGTVRANENRVLTTADEGSGNGLDADTVDGQDASEIGSVPSSTQSASGRAGIGRYAGVTIIGEGQTKEMRGLVATEIKTENGPTDINYIDGTTDSVSGTGWHNIQEKPIYTIKTDNPPLVGSGNGSKVKGFNVLGAGSHSHNI